MVARPLYPYLVLCAGLLTLADTLCRKPALPENALVVPLLGGVNLTCPGCKGRVSWSRRNQTVDRQDSGHLLLTAVNYKDEDTYTCHKGGAAICSVQLLMKDEIEKPEISCFLRFPTDNITCEWTPTRKLRPYADVTLIAWSLKRNHQVSGCSYSQSSRKFFCSSPYLEGDTGRHTLSLCVTGRTDCANSNTVDKTVEDLLQPNPPLGVRVTPLENQPRRLRVSWTPPELWPDDFYKLEYQVQYRVASSQHVSNETTLDTQFVIMDAMARRRHVVRVRAREEFHHTWSSWSKEVTSTPWTEEEEEFLMTPFPTDEYDPFFTSSQDAETFSDRDKFPLVDSTAAPRYTWLVAGITICITLLVLGILLRYREMKLLKLKGGLLRSLFQPTQKAPLTPPSSAALLLPPLSSPTGVTVTEPRAPGPPD